MASTYPTSLDSFTNPTSTDTLASPAHATQHADINDAMEAVQTKLAIGNTVIGTYTSYTPSFAAGVTIGNGVGSGGYCRVNNFVHVHGTFTLGSTSSVTAIIQMNVPVNINAAMLSSTAPYGFSAYYDTSAGATYSGGTMYNGNAGSVFMTVSVVNATYASIAYPTATIPFTWAVGDIIQWNLYYRAA